LQPGAPDSDSLGAVQQFVAQLWSEALNVPAVSDADNFFKLGGHSLTAMHVIDVVEQTFGVEFGGMREMCENPTLAEFIVLVAVRRASQGTGPTARR